MISALLEGVSAVWLPCTLALLLPNLGVVIGAGKTAPWAAGGAILGTSIGAWVRFSGWWFDQPSGAQMVGVAFFLLALAVTAIMSPRPAVTMAAAAGVGWIASWLWVPCVGLELANILNGAPSQPLAQLLPTVGYVVGVSWSLVVIGAAGSIHPTLARLQAKPIFGWIGIGLTVLLAATMAFGFYDDVLAELSRRSV